MIELTAAQFNRMKDNAIILHNVACRKEAEYSNISYGINVRCCRKERRMLTSNASDIIKLSNVKYNYVVILCNKKNCLYMFPQLSIISMSSLYSNGKKKIADSGYLVLFAGSTKTTKKGNFEMNWGKMISDLRRSARRTSLRKITTITNQLDIILALVTELTF